MAHPTEHKQPVPALAIPLVGLGTYLASGCYNAVREAIKCGYRHIDTAAFYGNEEEVGKAIRDCGVPRQQLFVTTKMWYTEHGLQKARNAFDKSFKLLGLDYVDLYLIHWPGTNLPDDSPSNKNLRRESWKALEQIVAEGKAKAIGVSNYTIDHMKELVEADWIKVFPACNQVEFHPLLFQRELMQFCQARGIMLAAYSPFAKGELFKNKDIVAIAKKVGKTVAQVLVRWAIQHGCVVLPKSDKPDRIRENATVFDFVLSDKQMAALDALNQDWHCTWDPTDIR